MERAKRKLVAMKNQQMIEDHPVPGSKLHTYKEIKNDTEKWIRYCNFQNVIFVGKKADQAGYQARTLGFENIVILNFANREKPGGYYMDGIMAQEPDLCRVFPQLYQSLENSDVYPFEHTDVITTDAIWCVRDSKTYEMISSENQQKFYFVSASAPNVRKGKEEWDEDVVRKTIVNILLTPIVHLGFTDPSKTCLILGSWGCSSYKNKPVRIANLFREQIHKYGGNYGSIFFAIPKTDVNDNHREFWNVFRPF